jgi:hypothetical protein
MFFIFLLISCSVGMEKTPEEKLAERLIGRWEGDYTTDLKEIQEFSKDGTWFKSGNYNKYGTWQAIAPDKIELVYTFQDEPQRTRTHIVVVSFSDENHVKLDDYIEIQGTFTAKLKRVY